MGLTRSRLVALLAVVALAVLLVVVAAAAATHSQSTSPGLDQPAAVDVLSVVMTLFGLVVAALAAYMTWAWFQRMTLRHGWGAGNGEWATRRAQAGAGATAVIVLFLLLLMLRALGVGNHHPGGATLGGFAGSHAKIPHTRPLPFSAAAGGLTILVVGLGVAALVIVPRLVRRARAGSTPDFADLGQLHHGGMSLARGVARDPLASVEVATPEREPDPRRAVVAAWIAMTAVMAETWRPRLESEAPREYLDRALVEAGVGPSSAGRLTDIFEEARFGGREVGESLRTEAIEALAQVRAELRPLAGQTSR